jgi:hypothetical protein
MVVGLLHQRLALLAPRPGRILPALSFSGQRKATPLSSERHRWLTTGQLSFIGLEYRQSNLGSFIELGVGNEGILSAGISLRF